MKGTLALWVLPDSRLRLLWRPASIAAGGPRTVDAAGTAGAISFMEDLVRVPGVSSLAGRPEPCGAGTATHTALACTQHPPTKQQRGYAPLTCMFMTCWQPIFSHSSGVRLRLLMWVADRKTMWSQMWR